MIELADKADYQIASTSTDLELLSLIAQRRPDLRAAVAANPATYEGLLQWLARLNDPAINNALANRAVASPPNQIADSQPTAPPVQETIRPNQTGQQAGYPPADQPSIPEQQQFVPVQKTPPKKKKPVGLIIAIVTVALLSIAAVVMIFVLPDKSDSESSAESESTGQTTSTESSTSSTQTTEPSPTETETAEPRKPATKIASRIQIAGSETGEVAYLGIDEKTGYLYASSIEGNTVKINPEDGSIVPIDFGYPYLIDSESRTAYVTILDEEVNTVGLGIYNLDGDYFKEAVDSTFPTRDLYLVKSEGKLYASSQNDNSVKVFDAESLELIKNISLPSTGGTNNSAPNNFAYNEETGYLYLTLSFEDALAVIDTETDQIVSTIRVVDVPYDIAFDPKSETLYISAYLLAAFDLQGNEVPSSFNFDDDEIWDIEIDPKANALYVARFNFDEIGSNKITVIDTTTNANYANVTLFEPREDQMSPGPIAVNHKTGDVYVACPDNEIVVLTAE